MAIKNSILFWQPKKDWLLWFESNSKRKKTLIVLNYLIWIFFFYLSYLLVKENTNVFWQILFATIIAEVLERFLKSKIYWRRPLFEKNDELPPGLVSSWYKTGAFPSGHTIKTIYFLFFILQYQVFPLPVFLLIVLPLLFFRVAVGFHYPIDILGGVIAGFIVWLSSRWIMLPTNITQIIRNIFNFIFRIQS